MTPPTKAAVGPDQGGPWYRHGWVWFIVCLLSTTVAAGIVTVVIAVRGADSLVVDDYYKDGKAINRVLEADREAALRGVRATLSSSAGAPELELDLRGDLPDALLLVLSHVTQSDRDRQLRFEREGERRYATNDPLPQGRFYAVVRPADEARTWRVRARLVLPLTVPAVLEPSR